MAYQSSSEPITSMPPVQADFSRTNGFTGYGRLILAEQMGLLVMVFLHMPL